MYSSAAVKALAPISVVTWTCTTPGASAGVVNVNEVAETPDGVTVVPPMVAVMPAVNPLPVTVTVWPPLTKPPAGVSALITGRLPYVYSSAGVSALGPKDVVTWTVDEPWPALLG